MAYAWLYHAGDRFYYWTESFTMSTTQFACEVSRLTGESLGPEHISSAEFNDIEKKKSSRTIQMIYVP